MTPPARTAVQQAWGCLLLAAALLVPAALLKLPPLRFDLARNSLTRLKPETIEELSRLPCDVNITYYVSSRRRMPTALRQLPDDVASILAEIRRRSHGRVRFHLIDPTDDADLCVKLGFKWISPFDLTSIRQDDYSVNRIWSAIVVEAQGHEKVIPAIVMEHLPSLEARIMRLIREIQLPSTAAIALSLPPPDGGLAQIIGSGAKLYPFNFEREPIPQDADMAFIVQPRLSPQNVRGLKAWLADGKNVFLFFSACRVAYEKGHTVSILPEHLGLEHLFEDSGVKVPEALVLDEQNYQNNPSTVQVLPFAMDMQRFKSKIVGDLLMPVASPIFLNRAQLQAAGWTAEPLMHSSGLAWTRPAPVLHLSWDDFNRPPQGPWMRLESTLGVMLKPQQPWAGRLFLFGSRFMFDDQALSTSKGNMRYLLNLLRTFTAEEYRPGVRLSAEKPPSLPELTPQAKALWRFFCVALFPLLLAGGLFRKMLDQWREINTEFTALKERLPALAWAPVALLLVTVVSGAISGAAWDWTRERLHQLDAASTTLYQTLPGTVVLHYVSSPPSELSAAGKEMLVAVHDVLRSVRRAAQGRLVVKELQLANDRTAAARLRASLAAAGVEPFSMESIEEDVYRKRPVYSAIVLESDGQREVISPLVPGSESKLEFLIDAALLRLQGRGSPELTLITEQPRLTPGEALEDYAMWSQPVPQAHDVYSQVRDLFKLYGYKVQTLIPKDVPRAPSAMPVPVHVSSASITDPSKDPDIWGAMQKLGFDAKSVSPQSEQQIRAPLLIFFQPFTLPDELKREIDRHLLSGGNVFLAAQHFSLQERIYRTRSFQPVYWPQPQFTRVNEWLNAYGVNLEREVLMDRNQKAATLETQIRWGVIKDNKQQPVSMPFMLHAVQADYNRESAVTRNLGDQLMVGGNRFLQQPKFPSTLRWTPLIETSDHASAYAWQSGFLQAADFDKGRLLDGKQPLAIELSGQFPAMASTGVVGKKSARLIAVGCSDMFRNEHLLDSQFRAADFLMNAIVDMSYGEPWARVHSKSTHRPQGFGYLSPRSKSLLRLLTLLLSPLLFLLVAFWRARQRSGKPIATTRRDQQIFFQ